jgi:hypothetical protein
MQFARNVLLIALLSSLVASAQTTEFTYQGSLKDGAIPANGNYDFEFLLFDALSGGSQAGSTITQNAVPVVDGVFNVKLDFGTQFASGANRWLEVRVRNTGGGAFVPLAPRSPITSTPYAIKSLTATNATQLGGVAANQYVVTTDPRMTDARPPVAGSSNYIQNSASTQAGANFNVSGNGTLGGKLSAQTVNTSTRFEINNARVLGLGPPGTLYVGQNAGAATTTGELNTFVGFEAGFSNTIGAANAFFGINAGRNQVAGFQNSYFGRNAGMNNVESEFNSYFGSLAGALGTSGQRNSFFGAGAGYGSTGSDNAFFGGSAGGAVGNGSNNSFFGTSSGVNNTSHRNSFFGKSAGFANTTGFDNAFFGYEAGRDNTTMCCNAFFGAFAGKLNSEGAQNTFLGYHAGHTNTEGDRNTFVGYYAGSGNNTGTGNTIVGWGSGENIIAGIDNTMIGHQADDATNGFNNRLTTLGAFAKTSASENATAIGARAFVDRSNALVLGSVRFVNGANSDTNVGIGTTNPGARLHIRDNGGNLLVSNGLCNAGFIGISFEQSFPFNCGTYALLGDGQDTIINRFIGGVIQFRENNVAQITINAGGTMSINALGSGGSTQLCRNGSNVISTCSSSLRYKTNLGEYRPGLSLVSRLRPISFDWKEGGMHDLGLGAEDVAAIEPLLVNYNSKGEVEGVKYDRIGVVLVNAVKEQQAEIDALRAQIEALKKLVCATNATAEVCNK